MRAEEIVKIINEDKFNEYNYNYKFEEGRDMLGRQVYFEVEDGYIILDEDNDSTNIEYSFTYFMKISNCAGDYSTPPSSGYDEEIEMEIKVHEDGVLVSYSKEDEELIKERILEIIEIE